MIFQHSHKYTYIDIINFQAGLYLYSPCSGSLSLDNNIVSVTPCIMLLQQGEYKLYYI
jgi:hypothetical protein